MEPQNKRFEVGRRSVLKGSATLAVATLGGEFAQAAEMKNDTGVSTVAENSATVVLERRGPILLIGLNRPAMHNMLDPPTYALLSEAYRQLDEDPALRVGVHACDCVAAGARPGTRSRSKIIWTWPEFLQRH
jgi:enoyl-CoA hydratase